MKATIAQVIRNIVAQWDNPEAEKIWKEDTTKDTRRLLQKYVTLFLNKLDDEPFPDDDKAVLRNHGESFLRFLKKLEGD